MRLAEDPQFQKIPPVAHWLLSEWKDAQSEFNRTIENEGLAGAVQAFCKDAYSDALETWEDELADGDRSAKHFVYLLFACWRSDITHKDLMTEPLSWSDGVIRGSRRFLAVYALLCAGLGDNTLSPNARTFAHADLPDGRWLAFIWGGGEKLVRTVITETLRISSPEMASVGPAGMIVVINPIDSPEPDRLENLVKELSSEITASKMGDSDDITAAWQIPCPAVICDNRIWNAIDKVPTQEAFSVEIRAVMGVDNSG